MQSSQVPQVEADTATNLWQLSQTIASPCNKDSSIRLLSVWAASRIKSHIVLIVCSTCCLDSCSCRKANNASPKTLLASILLFSDSVIINWLQFIWRESRVYILTIGSLVERAYLSYLAFPCSRGCRVSGKLL